ncbi:glycosyltransferase family 4 protein (plasmid) [Microvirga sp. M2]
MTSTSGVLAQRSQSKTANRVLFIVENLPVPFDRRVWSEATTLRSAGYEVSVICPQRDNYSAKYEVLEGIHIYRHPLPEASRKIGYLWEYANALFWQFTISAKIYRERGFDIIHACNPPDLIFLVGAFWKFLFGVKFVFDHHDLNPELFEAKFGRRGILWRVLVWLERLTFGIADISIATNDSFRRVAIQRGMMRPERVFTVRSGPNLSRIKELPPDSRWKKGKPYLVAYIGVIGEQEGMDLLLASVDYIVNTRGRKDVQFVIMGSGPSLSATIQQAADMGLNEWMEFPGRVDDKTLFTVLSTAEVCVNPDRPNQMNDKSTMNKIMEYMALGRPIVQYDLTEGRVSAQNASLYARNTDHSDFGDKILDLLDDPDRRATMAAEGRRRVSQELSWPHEAPKLLHAYQSLSAARNC